MKSLTFHADQESDTDQLGRSLAEALPDGATVALCGTLGAGKTRSVRAVAEACGIAGQDVVSPTFVLCQKYRGQRTIDHLDAYRLRDEDEFLELGPDELFESPSLTFIEWADKVRGGLPWDYLEIEIQVTGTMQRRFVMTAHGQQFEKALVDLAARLSR